MRGGVGIRTVASGQKGEAMTKRPDISYRVERKIHASPQAVYAVLSEPAASMGWAGKKAPIVFRLRDMQAPDGPLTKGDAWSSDGQVGYMKMHDRSTVVVAEPGRAFGFDTDSTVPRRVSKTWEGHFENRYTIRPDGDGSVVEYTCDGYGVNYVPFLWWPKLFRPMTHMMFTMMIKKTMKNLARQAAAKDPVLA